MPTLGQDILARYKTLHETLTSELGEQTPLPAFGEIDATEICLMVLEHFIPLHDQCKEYLPAIQAAARYKGIQIDQDALTRVYPQIKSYIDFVIEVLRREY